MPVSNMIESIRDALGIALAADDDLLILGEDVGRYGGVFRATEGLQERYGPDRVIDMPLAESSIIGAAIGLALEGYKPVCEIQFLGFLYPGFEQLISHVSRIRYRTQGDYGMSMVIRAPMGSGVKSHELHSDSFESFYVHIPGIKVVVPSNPYDAKGLLLAAIDDPDPVIFLEPTALYRAEREEVPAEIYQIPLGAAKLVREGQDLTMIAWGGMVPVVKEAAVQLVEDQIQCEIIDIRSLYPFDQDLIVQSVKKTGRVIVVHEAPRTLGVGAEVAAMIQEQAFLFLEAPIMRVTGYDVPTPLGALEHVNRPDVNRIKKAVQQVLHY
ncbi:pyruvate dehydrogenase E1 component beta subunit [Seinonella peptonophila]|uniref:Pyruvate dehydrogenase E1 component beta subunit n=1 Tax=Seinonella peptonophila TaxID=112248 RepID=A0A1M5ALT2_9BACL|nr:alpha-ketoacid dehydrogenase subunit beta [Seinonella peptonophila]SHF30872.1 pyruvate dehydrogenase E1 component beta subunit [Seinonella peptonophila]